MTPEDAISRLKQLQVEPRTTRGSGSGFWIDGWTAKVREVISKSLGSNHDLVAKLSGRLHPTPEGRINAASALIDAALYALEIAKDEPEPLDAVSFDSELWEHVNGLVAANDWGKIPATAATFTEDKFRRWSGSGEDRYGKGLYALALADDGPLRLGVTKPEWEGWRSLASGFAQAVGNVDRHRIQERIDVRQYAIGVLGVASLVLVQVRKEHPEAVAATE